MFPSMFIGAAVGVAASHLPGLPLVPAVAMGIGAMCHGDAEAAHDRHLLATLLLFSDGVAVMPLVIVAVVVAYVFTAWLPQTPADLQRKQPSSPAQTGPIAPPPTAAPLRWPPRERERDRPAPR